MRAAATLTPDLLRVALPAAWRSRVANVSLERTPHGSQRLRLRDRAGSTIALASAAPGDSVAQATEGLRGILLAPIIAQLSIAGRNIEVREYLPGHTLDVELAARRDDTAGAAALLFEATEILVALQTGSSAPHLLGQAELHRFLHAPTALIRSAPLLGRAEAAQLDSIVQSLQAHDALPLSFARHHGDFQFSNLLRTAAGPIAVIDWELSQGRAPLLMDLFHLLIAYEVERRHISYEESARCLVEQAAATGSAIATCLHRHAERCAVAKEEWGHHAVLCVLHGLAHFARRVPHRADAATIAGFLRAAQLLRQIGTTNR